MTRWRKIALPPVYLFYKKALEMTLHTKFQNLRTQLSDSLIGRDDEIDVVLLGLIAQEHVCLQGQWGLAKSMLLRSVCKAISGARFFEYILNKDTASDDVFGHIDMEVMANQRKWQPNLTYSALNSELVFGDEFFRGSSYIQNAFLGAMNERTVFYSNQVYKVPLRILVAGSNAWPVGEGFNECGAIFDRFLLRVAMKPVVNNLWADLLTKNLPAVPQSLTLQEVDQACSEAQSLPVSPEALEAHLEILRELFANGIRVGDRRIRKSVSVAKAASWMDGATEVKPIHLEPLKHVLWEDPTEQPEKAAGIVLKIANPVGSEIQTVLGEVSQILDNVGTELPKQMAAIKKLDEQAKKLSLLTNSGNGRAKKALQYVRHQRQLLYIKGAGIPENMAAGITGS